DAGELDIPTGKESAPSAREMEMASRLLEDMTAPWDPELYRDEYRDDLMATIEEKIESGRTHAVDETDSPPRRQSGKVIDLMSMLQRSIDERKDSSRKSTGTGKKSEKRPARKTSKTASKKSAAKKSSSSRKTASTTARKKKSA